jgi:hypothetical protein
MTLRCDLIQRDATIFDGTGAARTSGTGRNGGTGRAAGDARRGVAGRLLRRPRII